LLSEKERRMNQQKRLGVRDTLLLGGVGGLWIATFYIIPKLFYGGNLDNELTLWDSALTIVFSLLIMSLIEYKMSTREKTWQKVQFALAFAAALGLSIVCGYTDGVSEGMLRFAILLPIAFCTVWIADQLLAKAPYNKQE